MNKTQSYPLWKINIIGNYESALYVFDLFGWKCSFKLRICGFDFYNEVTCKTDICLN